MKLACTVATFFVALCGCSLLAPRTTNPVSAFALREAHRHSPDIRLLRIVFDINNDGYEDIALSSAADERDEKRWDMYLGDGRGSYAFLAALRFDPAALYVEPLDKGSTRLAVRRAGGKMTLYRIQGKKLRRIAAHPARRRESFGMQLGGRVESCLLSEYLKTRNCLWKIERPPQSAT